MHQTDIIIRHFQLFDMESLIGLYRACFAEPPWYESFNSHELIKKFIEIASWPDTVFLVATHDGEIVGGTIGFNFSRRTDVAMLVPKKDERCFYLSELFVKASMRRQGIAEMLMQERFAFARDHRYVRAVVRTSINQPVIRTLYERLGYQIVARQEVESVKMIDGVPTVGKDQRIILAGSIP